MPVPLPAPAAARLGPPEPDEVDFVTRGIMTAIRPATGHTETQRLLMTASVDALTGHRVDVAALAAIEPADFAVGLAARNEAFRTRVVQLMILGALVLRPIPPAVVDQVSAFARELSIDDAMLHVAHEFAHGHLGLAAFDFQRNGYTADWSPERARVLHTSRALADAWDLSVADAELAARWADLEGFAPGTLGRRVWEFYRARGFVAPGNPGSAPPLLAQHDWVHVLADYGTRVESELEVFAFIARANDDPRGFSLLAMVVSLFETGYLATGAGLFESSPGQLSHHGMACRVADAMRRGAVSHGLDGRADVDFLTVDWFALADRPVDELRDAFAICTKAPEAAAAGSVGPWAAGGISEFQDRAGRAAAERAGRPYEGYGASVTRP
jgi:hypothetical protein